MRTGLAGDYARLASPDGRGTRERIERRRARFAFDLLRDVAGIRLIPRAVGGSSAVSICGAIVLWTRHA